MAFPTIPTGGRVITGNQANTTATRTFPNLNTLTKNAGDLLIAIIGAYQSSTGTDAAFSGWTGGFTEFADRNTTPGTTSCLGAAYKFSDGTETGTFAVTQAATITGYASFIVLSIPGAHASTIPEASAAGNASNAGGDPASFNPTNWDVEDTLWIGVNVNGETSATGSWTGNASAPTNYGNYADTAAADTSTIGEVELAVAFRQNAAASEDMGAFTVDTSNSRSTAMVIAVRPYDWPEFPILSGGPSWIPERLGG